MAPIEEKEFKYSRIKLDKEQLTVAREFLEKQALNHINELLPKEKAKELLDRFIKYAESDWLNSGLLEQETISNTIIFNAKKSALICVDEINKALQNIPDLQVSGNVLLDQIKYYQEVKQEIINLN